MKAGIGATNIALISTTFVGLALFLISAMIVLSLIPIYTSRKDVSVANFQSSLFDLSYNTSSSLVSELSENTMVLLQGDLSSDRIQRLELILQTKLNANLKFKNLDINLSQATIESTNATTKHGVTNMKKIRRRRLVERDNVVIYRTNNNSEETEQLKISFRFVHRGVLSQHLISSALTDIFNQIQFNTTTFLELFSEQSSTVSDLSTKILHSHVKDNQIMQINGVNIFGIKDYNGNVQSIYAIQTNNTIYTINNRRIVQIQSADETLVFDYDNTTNEYTASLISANGSYEIPETYNAPNITFPTPVFEFSKEDDVPNFFTGVLVELRNRVNGRSIADATLLMNYLDSDFGNKSFVMLNTGGGRYYAPVPTNDSIFDKRFDMNKLQSTAIQQSDACLELIETYPIADICSKVPDIGKAFCSLVVQEMTVTIPDVLRIASQNIQQFQLQPQSSSSEVENLEVVIMVPGEELVKVFLDSSNQINVKSYNRSTRDIYSINPDDFTTFSVQIVGARGQCNEQTVAGGDTPDDRIIDIGKSHVTVKFTYETYTIKDQIDVYYMNGQVFSTGCVGANGQTSISLDNNERTLRVNVIPDCAGESGTQWYYTIECLNELICEDNICYCGLSRQRSRQIKTPSANGCGPEDGPYNFLLQTIGVIWGFTGACVRHDLCYDRCNVQKGCTLTADAFGIAVSFGGTDAFVSAQNAACDCNTNRRKREIYYSNITSST